MEKVNKILLELYNDRKQFLVLSLLGCISYLMEDVIPSDPNIIHATGLWVGLGSLGLSGVGMILGGKAAGDAADAAEANNLLTAQIARENLEFQKEQQAKLDEQKEIYKAMEFINPYANVESQYANMQNAYEDLTVNQQQAEFIAQKSAQQRTDIMQSLRGAAGASGIAGLAQAMANQGQLQAQEAAASIGMQESRILQLQASEASRLQQLEAAGETQAEMTRLGGEAMLQTMEMDRQATLLGISMGESAGANAAAMQAQQNQVAAAAAEANLYGQQAASFYGMAGQGLSAAGSIAAAGISGQ